MNSSGSQAAPGQADTDDPTWSAATSATGQSRSNRQVWGIALTIGFLAGLAAWIAGELTYGLFRPQLFRIVVLGVPSLQPSRQSLSVADIKNGTLTFALLGCLTGLAMGFAGGVADRSPWRGAKIGAGAMVLGGLVGAGTSMALLPLFFRGLVPDISDLLTPIMIHGVVWGAISAVGGLAFAIGMRRHRNVPDAIIGACLGAVLATILYHCSNELFFPESKSTEPIATLPIVRLLAMLLVSVLLALGAVWGTSRPRARSSASLAKTD